VSTSPRAVLLVDHGSREEAANAVLDALAAALGRRMPEAAVHVAHLEIAAPGIAEVIDRCAAADVREVVICPCFVAPGRHASRDLPRIAEEASRRHPGLSITVAAPLGAHPALVEALADRIREAGPAAGG
jgi:sirohydrochlorin ferrochelatase